MAMNFLIVDFEFTIKELNKTLKATESTNKINKFKEMHYIDKNGKVQEALKTAIDLDIRTL